MPTQSAVTQNAVRAMGLAAQRCRQEVDELSSKADGLRSQAQRGSSLYAAPAEIAACYVMDDIRRLIKLLTNAEAGYKRRITELRTSPCPSCHAGHRQHCEECGSCPGRGRGPSCQSLGCMTVETRAKASV